MIMMRICYFLNAQYGSIGLLEAGVTAGWRETLIWSAGNVGDVVSIVLSSHSTGSAAEIYRSAIIYPPRFIDCC